MLKEIKKKISLGLITVLMAGIAGAGAFALTAVADVVPLTASCSGAVSTSTIVWTATTTGGTAPFSYLWSGTNVTGTSSSVTAVYTATGTYQANIQVIDSATSTVSSTVTSTPKTATSTCSATVTVLPVVTPTSTPPTPTSTPPAHNPVFVGPMLSINPGGHFTARGMVVTSVASGSFQGQIWGITYTVNTAGSLPQFFMRWKGGGVLDLSQLQVGDVLGVSGEVTASSSLVVQAKIIRDYSLSNPRPKFPKIEDSDRDENKDQNDNQSTVSASTTVTIQSNGRRGHLSDILGTTTSAFQSRLKDLIQRNLEKALGKFKDR